MDKRRTVKFYGFVEAQGFLEDFYYHNFAEGVGHLTQIINSRSMQHGIIMAQNCGIPDDETTWVIVPGHSTLTLKGVKLLHGSVDNYMAFLFNDQTPLEEVNWIKEGF